MSTGQPAYLQVRLRRVESLVPGFVSKADVGGSMQQIDLDPDGRAETIENQKRSTVKIERTWLNVRVRPPIVPIPSELIPAC